MYLRNLEAVENYARAKDSPLEEILRNYYETARCVLICAFLTQFV